MSDQPGPTEQEKGQYKEFVAAQLAAFQERWGNIADDMVWHYTSGDGLVSILKSGELWCTQVSCLNDSSEIRYAAKLLANALSQYKDHARASRLVTEYVRLLTDDKSSGIVPYFVTCFSGEKDSLNQWRAYAGGENGYALGFSLRDLVPSAPGDGALVKVNYDRAFHEEKAGLVAGATVDFYLRGLKDRSDDLAELWARAFLLEWDTTITHLAPLIKDPGFQSEKEYRIVYKPVAADLSRFEFRQKQTLLSQHCRLRFGTGDGFRLLPIREVVIGPSRHKEVSCQSINSLLSSLGYSDGTVSLTISECPYQLP